MDKTALVRPMPMTSDSPFNAAGISFVSGVADSVFADLIGALEDHDLDHGYVRATREDNAVGLAVGATLAGEQAAVFMESAGFGTALDALTSLAIAYNMPIVLIIAWAGFKGRDVPHHNAIGLHLMAMVKQLGLPVATVTEADLGTERFVDVLSRARDEAHSAGIPAAILVIPSSLLEARDEPR